MAAVTCETDRPGNRIDPPAGREATSPAGRGDSATRRGA